MARQPMSMEAMLDEERLEVLALLEGNSAPQVPRTSSPYNSTRSPMRSMLDVGGHPTSPPPPAGARSASTTGSRTPPPAPIRSMLDVGGPASPPPVPIRSMLDVDSPPPSATKSSFGSHSRLPAEPRSRASSVTSANISHHRSVSDASSKPADFGPRTSQGRLDLAAGYQFSDIITSYQPAMPKRVSQGGKKSAKQTAPPGAGIMADIMRGNDVSNIILPGSGRGRHYSVGGSSTKSKSPHNRLGLRSSSPRVAINARQMSPAGRAVLDDGQTIDMQNAYRRLSDAHLARSGGSLSELTRRKRSDDAASGRLQKDYMSPDGDVLIEDSSDDHGSSSDEGERGRNKAPRSIHEESGHEKIFGVGFGNDRKPLSLLAAAEEERTQVAASQHAYQYRSLLDEPEITVTNPSGERVKQARAGIHPATSFDQHGSGTQTPRDSDEEADYTDIRRAQKLSFSMTPVMSSPDAPRAIRIIYRGDFAKIQQEADEEHRRLRKYLVATDLSDESAHALEWAIGTVLRDGDTLIAIYCVDEETGIVAGDDAVVADEPKAMQEQAAALNMLSSARVPAAALYHQSDKPSSLAAYSRPASPAPASSSRERTKGDEERHRAVANITERVTKLLRKTKLQVRVIVEVLYCKNPKHMITEVIDLVNPTLVVLGSRGRSALKGVILGSFSNYLVTKSSVPVMVARRRLRKQNKYKRPAVQQVNNISNPTTRSLANAKID